MKTFKELVKEQEALQEAFAQFGEISDKKKFDPKNPDVLVHGVGVYKFDQLKRNIQRKLEDLVEKAKNDNFNFIHEALNQKGILSHFINAVLEVEKELQSPVIKRKVTLMTRAKEEKELGRKIINEVAPPDKNIEKWIRDNKERFKKEYGAEKGIQVLYAKAWDMYKQKH